MNQVFFMDKASQKQLLGQLEEAVIDSGALIKENWQNPKEIKHKGRIDLVTQTDLQIEERLKHSLGKILPEADFLAEESASSWKNSDLLWIIDPLDGTTNFAHSLMQVAVSVALWRKNRIELGLIYIPLTGEIFSAKFGQGAYLNKTEIAVSQTEDLEQSLVATGFPYDIREKSDQILPPLKEVLVNCRGVRRMGSAAIDLAYTACGRFDGYFEQGLKPWDTAAGWLMVQEAGGKVTLYSPNQEYYLQAPTILATNGRIHNNLATLLT